MLLQKGPVCFAQQGGNTLFNHHLCLNGHGLDGVSGNRDIGRARHNLPFRLHMRFGARDVLQGTVEEEGQQRGCADGHATNREDPLRGTATLWLHASRSFVHPLEHFRGQPAQPVTSSRRYRLLLGSTVHKNRLKLYKLELLFDDRVLFSRRLHRSKY